MYVLKNSDIAKKYNVSNSTVTRWVSLAEEGKNNLQLYKVGGKVNILDNAYNHAEITKLSQEGKKYRSNIACKRIAVNKDFYNIFVEEDIIDIITDLELKRLIKSKHVYMGDGSKYWDQAYNMGLRQSALETVRLIQESRDLIFYNFEKKDLVNVVDLGPGNGLAIRPILETLMEDKLVNKYIVLDISKEMNLLSQQNLSKWFPGLEILAYQRDFERSNFSRIMLENKALDNLPNLIFHLGNVLCHYSDRVRVLKNIQRGMSYEDLLVIDFVLENEDSKFNLGHVKSDPSNQLHTWIPKMLGVDTNLCEQKIESDRGLATDTKYLILDKDYEISFDLFGKRRVLELFSGEKIALWRRQLINMETFLAEAEKADLQVVNLSLEKNGISAVATCKLKPNSFSY